MEAVFFELLFHGFAVRRVEAHDDFVAAVRLLAGDEAVDVAAAVGDDAAEVAHDADLVADVVDGEARLAVRQSHDVDEGLEDVGLRDDADDGADARHDGQAADLVVVHDERGFLDGRVILDGDDLLLHDFADAHFRQERGDLVARERRRGRRRDAHDVAVAQEADELAVFIDDGQAAEAVLLHQILRGRDLRVRCDGEGIFCHAVCYKHCQHPFFRKRG